MGAADEPDAAELARRFDAFSATTAARAPLYSRLSADVPDEPEVLEILLAAPPTQRSPVLLFAAVHRLLFDHPDAELTGFYPNLTATPASSDPFPAFRAFCRAHRAELTALVASRSTQTNEVNRCAFLVPPLGLVAEECGPLALVDVGTSAGLNLLVDHYAYEYRPGGTLGGDSTVVLECGTRGEVPVPHRLPEITARVGLDRAPIDPTDPIAARWLEACVWPDQTDRFRRLRAALALARELRPRVVMGDAVDDVAALVAGVASDGHPVVLNTWMLSYLTHDERTRYLAALDAIGAMRPLTWIYAEEPAQVSGLPVPSAPDPRGRTVVTMVRWRDGVRSIDHLATAHPHGFWLHWN